MGGGDHGPARLLEVPDGEVERVGRDHPEVQNVGPGFSNAFDKRFFERLATETHVSRDHDPRPRQPELADECATDVAGDVFIQGVWVDAPDVVGFKY